MKKLLLILTILLFAFSAWGATYHVSTSGSDVSADPTDWTTPWQTVTKVESSVSGSGDRVLFKCGDVWNTSTELSSDYKLTIDWASAFVGAYRAADGAEVDGSAVVCAGDKPKLTPNASGVCPGPAFCSSTTHSVISVEHATTTGTTISDLILEDGCGMQHCNA
jgi:hypothetical protein